MAKGSIIILLVQTTTIKGLYGSAKEGIVKQFLLLYQIPKN